MTKHLVTNAFAARGAVYDESATLSKMLRQATTPMAKVVKDALVAKA